ncbi:MlaD family protein [Antrihabitans sp. YC2-6]|uniref:MlaD family protein n=1 Tax=Antrihabitans sp. YC2-6 TaxID=2799498 RepID=UPI0018F7811D|nr:MlaD family protein [Antrihabitans sp. YC2-6]MBJ8345178.1 MCE family protein [Antrihabitans sp. YC2-6]
MQRQLKRRAPKGGGPVAILKRVRENDVLLGTSAVVLAVVILAAAALYYLHPPGRKTLSFETTDAASLAVGQDVRVAGISIGKITKISIQPTTVRAEAEIEGDTFIGSDSTVDVRMLTPVGGYAVTVIPNGDQPLGDQVIAVDHVSVPYSISEVLQAAPHVTDEVEGGTINANIEQVADALEHNSGSVASFVNGMNSIATVMDQQREQVRTIMNLASEYTQTFNGSRDFVFELIRQIEIVLSTYNGVSAGFNESYRLLGDVVERIQSLERFYLNHKDEVLAAVNGVRGAITEYQTTLAPAIDQMQGLRAQLEAWLGPDGLQTIAGGTVMASNVCIPIPGRTC